MLVYTLQNKTFLRQTEEQDVPLTRYAPVAKMSEMLL